MCMCIKCSFSGVCGSVQWSRIWCLMLSAALVSPASDVSIYTATVSVPNCSASHAFCLKSFPSRHITNTQVKQLIIIIYGNVCCCAYDTRGWLHVHIIRHRISASHWMIRMAREYAIVSRVTPCVQYSRRRIATENPLLHDFHRRAIVYCVWVCDESSVLFCCRYDNGRNVNIKIQVANINRSAIHQMREREKYSKREREVKRSTKSASEKNAREDLLHLRRLESIKTSNPVDNKVLRGCDVHTEYEHKRERKNRQRWDNSIVILLRLLLLLHGVVDRYVLITHVFFYDSEAANRRKQNVFFCLPLERAHKID